MTEIVVHCSPEKAVIIGECQSFPQQQSAQGPDGSLALRFPDLKLRNVVSRVLSYAERLDVAESTDLRAEVLDAAKAVVARDADGRENLN